MDTMKWCLLFYVMYFKDFNIAEGFQILDLTEAIYNDKQNLGTLSCHDTRLDLGLDKTYQIRVENHYIAYTRCGVTNDMQIINMYRDLGYGFRFIYWHIFLGINKPGLHQFQCRFYQHTCRDEEMKQFNVCYYNDQYNNRRVSDGVTCVIHLNVEEPNGHVPDPIFYLEANGKNYSSTKVTERHYYYEGEGTYFTCHASQGSVKLQHTTATGQPRSTAYALDTASMYIKLTAALRDTTVTCTSTISGSTGTRYIKLKLDYNEDIRELLAFEVNGMIPPHITTTHQNGTISTNYRYIYELNEILTVTLTKDNTTYGPATCYVGRDGGGDIPNNLTKQYNNQTRPLHWTTFTQQFYDGGSGVYVRCVGQTYDISITFELFRSDINNKPPFILKNSNMLFAYSHNKKNIYEYEITNQEDLMIRSTTYRDFNYNSAELCGPSNGFPQGKFQLRPDHDDATIECGKTQLKLFRNKNQATTLINPSTDICKVIVNGVTTSSTTTSSTTTSSTTTSSTTTSSTTTSSTTTRPTTSSSTTTTTPTTPSTTSTTSNSTNTKQSRSLLPDTLKPTKPTKSNSKSKRPTKPTTKRTTSSSKTTYIPSTTSKSTSTLSIIFETTLTTTMTSASTYKTTNRIISSASTPTLQATLTPVAIDASARKDKPVSAGTAWVIPFCTSVAVLLAAFALWMAFKYIKRRRTHKHSTSDMDYQNLPGHLEGSMATPSQWNRDDDVTYDEPINENLYTTPVPKNLRKKVDPTYAEPGDSMNITYQNAGHRQSNYTSTLTSPSYEYIQKCEPTYASAQKTIRDAISKKSSPASKNTYQNYNPNVEETYAQVQKKQSRANNTDVNPSDNVVKTHYQNVANLEHSKTPAAGQPYANVGDLKINSSKYVNANVKHEVEPAYCEVTK